MKKSKRRNGVKGSISISFLIVGAAATALCSLMLVSFTSTYKKALTTTTDNATAITSKPQSAGAIIDLTK